MRSPEEEIQVDTTRKQWSIKSHPSSSTALSWLFLLKAAHWQWKTGLIRSDRCGLSLKQVQFDVFKEPEEWIQNENSKVQTDAGFSAVS